ncbi:3'-5' exonuclease [Buchnera aphidicola]|uniref:3'-5' exonuclease n=1 Tax=Buchnera aphidicola TaxID=9 RepID=UPI0034649AFD
MCNLWKKLFFNCLEVKVIILCLGLIINMNNNSAFLQIINIIGRNIGTETIKKIEEYAYKTKNNLFSVTSINV